MSVLWSKFWTIWHNSSIYFFTLFQFVRVHSGLTFYSTSVVLSSLCCLWMRMINIKTFNRLCSENSNVWPLCWHSCKAESSAKTNKQTKKAFALSWCHVSSVCLGLLQIKDKISAISITFCSGVLLPFNGRVCVCSCLRKLKIHALHLQSHLWLILRGAAPGRSLWWDHSIARLPGFQAG